ncbi:fde2e43a-4776-4754-b8bd-632c2b07384e [Thermothielavioides terrestris]|uniref:Carboxylic ester hydrolase n=1 Tax=Thermothielavioides terrestris TaxID=2587410 RepID=A0A3S4C9H6_9PEZI|nr:fde2e43a-4776-4754-b8bd-632c2b07384e [Thermothielavioides terrestris]
MALHRGLAAIAVFFLAVNALAASSGFWRDRQTAPSGSGSRCNSTWFERIVPAGATVEKVAVVQQGGTYGEGVADSAYPTDPTDLPALCAVTVRVQSSASSSYRFGLFLPDEWNSRFLVVGNGGWAGGINWLDMAAGPRSGMAALSTDTGHSSGTTDSAWARSEPEKKTDWGWRAVHGSTVLGKQLVSIYYGDKQRLARSYYSGCSTGGRQGLKELQLFAESFDGALIGAPAWWTSHLNTYLTQAGLYNLPATDSKHLSLADMSLIANEVTRQCDSADGVADGIVSSPELCKPDLSRLLCPSTTPNNTLAPCLTQAQMNTAQNIYNPFVAPATANTTDEHNRENQTSASTNILHPGLTPSSEPQWWLVLGGDEPSPFGVGYARDFLYDDGGWDWRTFDAGVVAFAEAADPGNATAGDFAALARVRQRGGKLLLYHGLADGQIPAGDTELFFRRVVERAGKEEEKAAAADGVADFLRMFLVPGMGHCFGTSVDAPWDFGGAMQAGVLGSSVRSVPGFEDADHDALMALVEWVEHGRPVDRLVATTWNSPLDAASGVKRQRPICAWPKKAVWDGKGNVDAAASWTCSS